MVVNVNKEQQRAKDNALQQTRDYVSLNVTMAILLIFMTNRLSLVTQFMTSDRV